MTPEAFNKKNSSSYPSLTRAAKIPTLIITGLITATMASQAASVILHGPTDYTGIASSVTSVDTIASGELNGTDNLFITYTVNNTLAADGSYGPTLTMNAGAGLFDFTTGGVGGFLTRVQVGGAPGPHNLWASGALADTDAAPFFTASDGEAHAVRITLNGFSSNNEFTGTHTALFEVDHFATSFTTADASMTAILDFGGTDNGLTLRLNAITGALDVDNLTVYQVPEPSSTALLGLGGLAFIMRRKRS